MSNKPLKNILKGPQKVKRCMLCVRQVKYVDYKNLRLILKHISSFTRIMPRRYTGTCIHHQKMIAQAIKRARFMALLPFTMEHRQLKKD